MMGSDLAIGDRRRRAARHYLRGRSLRWIGHRLGVSHETIRGDLAAVRAEWAASAAADVGVRTAEELARLDELELTYWRAWERSIGPRTVEASEISTGGGGDGEKLSTRTETLVGDPRYLSGVERCIERRCRLLGLDAPVKTDSTIRAGVLYIDRDLGEAV